MAERPHATGASPESAGARYRTVRHRRPPRWNVLGLWLVVCVLVVVLLAGGIGAPSAKTPPAKGRQCTHGVSSIGPVTVENGKVVGGSTVPRTQACLP
jgi:hypothetical protein